MRQLRKSQAQLMEIWGLTILLGAAIWQVMISDSVSQQKLRNDITSIKGMEYGIALAIHDLASAQAASDTKQRNERIEVLKKEITDRIEKTIDEDNHQRAAWGAYSKKITVIRMGTFILGSFLLIYSKLWTYINEKEA